MHPTHSSVLSVHMRLNTPCSGCIVRGQLHLLPSLSPLCTQPPFPSYLPAAGGLPPVSACASYRKQREKLASMHLSKPQTYLKVSLTSSSSFNRPSLVVPTSFLYSLYVPPSVSSLFSSRVISSHTSLMSVILLFPVLSEITHPLRSFLFRPS